MSSVDLGAACKIQENEEERSFRLSKIERELEGQGFSCIAGVDEAGRGPLAGPVVAAACVMKKFVNFCGLNDSKLLTPARRRNLFCELVTHSDVLFGIGVVSPSVIDEINILQASLKAMRQAVANLQLKPDFILVDGNQSIGINQILEQTVVGGDRKSYLIAAASIIAKETRDELMRVYDSQYPEYGFAEHKGYGTAKHRNAILTYGPCPIHRKTFAPLKNSI